MSVFANAEIVHLRPSEPFILDDGEKIKVTSPNQFLNGEWLKKEDTPQEVPCEYENVVCLLVKQSHQIDSMAICRLRPIGKEDCAGHPRHRYEGLTPAELRVLVFAVVVEGWKTIRQQLSVRLGILSRRAGWFGARS